MQVLFIKLKENYKKFNKLSKYILKFGTPIVFSLYLSALFCFIMIKFGISYDYLIRLQSELLECAKESFGSVFLCAFVIQIFFMAKDQ